MSAETPRSELAELSANSPGAHPTRVRIGVAAVLTLMSCLLYLDRFAVGIASEYIREDLRMTQTQMSWFLSAFFWSYALSQVPAGWLSDRFGPRLMLTIYILAWSAFTGLLGMAAAVWMVLHLRLYMGAAQAGAFPVCGGLIRAWFPISQRGTASSIIALGGRAGGVLAPILTAWLIIWSMPAGSDPRLKPASEVRPIAALLRFEPSKLKESRQRTLLNRIINRFSPTDIERVQREAGRVSKLIDAAKMKPQSWGEWCFEIRSGGFARIWNSTRVAVAEWIPGMSKPPESKFYLPDAWSGESEEAALLAHSLADQMLQQDFFEPGDIPRASLGAHGKVLLDKRSNSHPLTDDEVVLLNRLVLEAAFPNEIKKFYGPGWRPTLIGYGIAGLVVALAFAWVGRNSPKQHPWCNDAERRLIDDEATRISKAAQPADAPFPWKAVLTSLSLWGNSAMQFFTNIGWLFVVTWLPRYLDKVHGVPLAEQALMTAVPTAAGIIGMFCGGWWTDLAARTAGLKWGRRLPVFSTRLLAAFGYGICLVLGLTCTPDPTTRWLPWAIVAGLSVMVMGVDLGIPAVWAYAQDVGGKYTASILGWANMWGNLGAAAAPLIYNAVLGETPTVAQWNVMFAVCAVAFILSGLCGLVLDATKPISAKS